MILFEGCYLVFGDVVGSAAVRECLCPATLRPSSFGLRLREGIHGVDDLLALFIGEPCVPG